MKRFALVAALALGSGPASTFAADPPPTSTPAPAEKTADARIDELFDRLAKTEDEDEAAGIVHALQAEWLHSGSDASDLLMSRVIAALGDSDVPLALSLLDVIVKTQPDWAEGWNKRATVRFYAGDNRGSAQDVAETLKLNPRHIGALAGLSAILEEQGRKDEALTVMDRALKLAPHYKPLVESESRLKAAVAGQAL